jgi:hypothetical protein
MRRPTSVLFFWHFSGIFLAAAGGCKKKEGMPSMTPKLFFCCCRELVRSLFLVGQGLHFKAIKPP